MILLLRRRCRRRRRRRGRRRLAQQAPRPATRLREVPATVGPVGGDSRTNSGLSAGQTARTARPPRAAGGRGRRGRRRTRRPAGWSAARGTGGAGSRARRGSRRPRSRPRARAGRGVGECLRRGRRSSATESSFGVGQSPYGDAATARRSASRRRRARRSRRPPTARCVDALRPACASWMPGDRALAADEVDDAPVVLGLLVGPDAGVPPGRCGPPASPRSPRSSRARRRRGRSEPRCTRCQSVGRPSSEEYWHMGETQTRLRNVVPRRVRGSKSRLTPGVTPAAAAAFRRVTRCTRNSGARCGALHRACVSTSGPTSSARGATSASAASRRRWPRSPHADEVDVVWHSFELDPTRRAVDRRPAGGAAGRQVRPDRRAGQQANDSSTGTAAEEGLDFHLDEARPGNTLRRPPAAPPGRRASALQGQLKERLLRAYFTERVADRRPGRRSPGSRSRSDWTPPRWTRCSASDEYADAVRADEAQAHAYGISGVPFFVVDDVRHLRRAAEPSCSSRR